MLPLIVLLLVLVSHLHPFKSVCQLLDQTKMMSMSLLVCELTHMDGVCPLLECSLKEGHNIGLVLSELDKLGLKLIIPLLKPPKEMSLTLINKLFCTYLSFSFLRSSFSSRLLIWMPNHSLSTSEIFSPALASSPWVGLPLPPLPFFLGPIKSESECLLC